MITVRTVRRIYTGADRLVSADPKGHGTPLTAYLKDVLTRMVAGHPINRADELLPWNWKSQSDLNT